MTSSFGTGARQDYSGFQDVSRCHDDGLSTVVSTTPARVNIIIASEETELPRFIVPRHRSVGQENLWQPSLNVDTVRHHLRIALEADNVFICDQFLGTTGAQDVVKELCAVRQSGQFEESGRRSRNHRNGSVSSHSNVFLRGSESAVISCLDFLVIQLHDLVNYCCLDDAACSLSACLTYYPRGHGLEQLETPTTNERELCAVYFPSHVDTEKLGERSSAAQTETLGAKHDGALESQTGDLVEALSDRLVIFYTDVHRYKLLPCRNSRFLVSVFFMKQQQSDLQCQ